MRVHCLVMTFIAFSLLSCDSRDKFVIDKELFEAQNYVKWFTADRVTIVNNKYVNSGKAIITPPYVWQPLLRVEFLESRYGARGTHCLFYRIPHGAHNGILRVIEVVNKERCTNQFDRKHYSQLENITELKIFLPSHVKKQRGWKKKVHAPFAITITMRSSKTEKEVVMEYPLMNLDRGRIAKRYQSDTIQRKIPGVLFLPATDKHRGMGVVNIGALSDDYQARRTIRCLNLNKKCEVTKDNCNSCRYGWYEAVSGDCSDRLIRFCGISRCGKKGWPACPRGRRFYRHKERSLCFEGSQAGFCKPGLRTYCDENKVLICL